MLCCAVAIYGAWCTARYSAKHAVCDNLAHGPMDAVLHKLIASWQEMQLPVRSIQLDDWWYEGGSDSPFDARSHDHMCVRDFTGKPALWPTGLPVLPENMSYLLYGPYVCVSSCMHACMHACIHTCHHVLNDVCMYRSFGKQQQQTGGLQQPFFQPTHPAQTGVALFSMHACMQPNGRYFIAS